MILHIKGLGKIVDGGVAQPQGNLTDGIAVFQQHLAASLQLFIIDVLFRGLVDGILEHQLNAVRDSEKCSQISGIVRGR